ncbi:hypothetical protein [Streptomyces aquilus]
MSFVVMLYPQNVRSFITVKAGGRSHPHHGHHPLRPRADPEDRTTAARR